MKVKIVMQVIDIFPEKHYRLFSHKILCKQKKIIRKETDAKGPHEEEGFFEAIT